MLNNDADLMFETLDALGKHTDRLNVLDKKVVNQSTELVKLTNALEKQIESSSKDLLLKILDKGNSDKEQLVKDITNVIASSIAELSINAGDVIVNIETESIANAIAKLPINNTNNITVDTKPLIENNKQLLNMFQSMDKNLLSTLAVIQTLLLEMSKNNEKEVEIENENETEDEDEKLIPISGMKIVRDKDNLLDYVKFERNH